MSKQCKRICDRCGDEIKDSITSTTKFNIIGIENICKAMLDKPIAQDLCVDCTKEFEEFLENGNN